MLETTRPAQRDKFASGPGGLGSPFDTCDSGELVTVRHGLHVEQLPVGNQTVADIRARHGDRFDIDPESYAQIDGHIVGDDVVVRPGQMVMFVRHAGEKGADV